MSAMIWQGWVSSVKRVDDGHGRVLGKLQHAVVIGGADHDGVDVARQHLRRVADRLRAAELHFRAREEQRLAAELAHADVEGDTGAGRGLLEDHRQHLAGKRLVGRASLGRLLADLRVLDDAAQIGSGDRGEIEEMLWGCHDLSMLQKNRAPARAGAPGNRPQSSRFQCPCRAQALNRPFEPRQPIAGLLGGGDERRQQTQDVVAGGHTEQMLGADRLQQLSRRDLRP